MLQNVHKKGGGEGKTKNRVKQKEESRRGKGIQDYSTRDLPEALPWCCTQSSVDTCACFL